jgi:hypothetical protein
MIGHKFNKLTVVSLNRIAVQNKSVWNCVCDCGQMTTAWNQSLTDARKTSCGCDDPRQYARRNGRPELTAGYLREIMDYERETGVLRWRVSLGGKGRAGERVGTVGVRGHRVTHIDGRAYRTARLCWMHVTGEMPKQLVDHKNTVRDDDRWDNLRQATHVQNARNTSAKSPASGLKGAYRENGRARWFSSIRIEPGKNLYLGSFDTKEEAHAAYAAAAAKYHGEFARAA